MTKTVNITIDIATARKMLVVAGFNYNELYGVTEDEIFEKVLSLLDCYGCGFTTVHKSVVKLREMEDKNEWHSVEDQLPKENVRVLVCVDSNRSNTNIDTDRILDGNWVRWGNDITHWMSLPMLPEGKE